MNYRLDSHHPIGLFDSGVGGFTVLNELKKLLPREKFLYFGDTNNVPYGDKPPELIREWAFNSINFLLKLRVKAVVVACNISSSVLTDDEIESLPVPTFSLVKYGARRAAEVSKVGKVGVLATTATVQTGSYERALRLLNDSIFVAQSACPKLVPLVEGGKFAGEEVESTTLDYLSPILSAGVDTIIYGCSHYPLLSKVIEKHVNGVALVDPAVELAKAVKAELGNLKALRSDPSHPDIFFVSRLTENFVATARKFLGVDISGQVLEFSVNG